MVLLEFLKKHIREKIYLRAALGLLQWACDGTKVLIELILLHLRKFLICGIFRILLLISHLFFSTKHYAFLIALLLTFGPLLSTNFLYWFVDLALFLCTNHRDGRNICKLNGFWLFWFVASGLEIEFVNLLSQLLQQFIVN